VLGKLSDSCGERLQEEQQPGRTETKKFKPSRCGSHDSDTNGIRLEKQRKAQGRTTKRTAGFCKDVPNTDGTWQPQPQRNVEEQRRRVGDGSWWEVEPGIRRVVDECSHRLERLKGLGNAQVPLCAAVAWEMLFERINEE
jgi:hypothetical protein